ncbi:MULTISPECIES: acetyl-CoA acetyltransferase [unclassified Caulobacter]|uniref:acetyl-CoA acetyltransferase n=1 Tax=unclassified Caulobacter TaxID=2648921 RepID=UPI0006FD0B52|nr:MULTISPECIES: acetyl-CoA acetyltransferase [unclassified Caulobacter]KQV57097.1 acetyl-CoA acetyltransferase [Caulobacter sp. Root342]KQV66583.1 acetyl-CoA acetyltransferase [Caulobacter sp. Root343]
MRDDTPVLIGAGQFTYRGDAGNSPSPLQLLKLAAERAVLDAGLKGSVLADLDALAVVAFSIDAPGGLSKLPLPRLADPPASLARALSARPRWSVYTETGGNSPQQAVNIVCERIAGGESDLALVAGAEFLGSLMKRMKGGLGFDGWGDDLDSAPQRIGDPRPGVTAQEAAHGLGYPVNTYPLFENALRARDGRSIEDHQNQLGALFTPFTKVAAANPHAWFPTERSAEELITVTDRNRMVGFPYPKYLNAIMEVDQSAAVLIASVRKARALGVPEDRWVFLHGCADASDLWYPLERQNYHSSPAMRLTGERALEMAGIGLEDLALIDLYSCFPSAVRIGAEELGLALDDPRGLTVTGGLPYFGGPGNNYALHAIAEMAVQLRERPGAYGLTTANGWFLTKQSVGIYSTKPVEGRWERQSPSVIQARIDALPHPEIVERPEGKATIETYTAVHGREGVRMGVVIGRDDQGRRFVAQTPDDPVVLRDLESREGVGRTGSVGLHPDGVRNLFVPDPAS